ncbi:hypothetical protein Tco_0235834 [Tanacetum coccineum]
MVMMSDKIKASADYLNYLAKSMGTQLAKGQGKGMLTNKGVEVVMQKTETILVPKKKCTATVIEETGQSKEVADIVDSEETGDKEEGRLSARQTGIVIGRGVYKESDEETLDHSKKLKGHPKGPGEGSSSVLANPDEPNDSSSSESKIKERFLTTDDEESQEKSDNERTKTDNSDVDAGKKAKDAKDVDEQAGQEQAIDEQAGIKQIGKVQAEVNPANTEIQSMVDVPILQEDPIIQRN